MDLGMGLQPMERIYDRHMRRFGRALFPVDRANLSSGSGLLSRRYALCPHAEQLHRKFPGEIE